MPIDVSVIIPTFRRPRELREALDSIRSQIGTEWEAIVIDDSPEAGAREIVESFNDPRIRYIMNPTPTKGFPSRVRNLGLSVAKGDLLHFLDDDDLAPTGLYERVKQAFATRPDVGVVFGRVQPFGSVQPDQLERERQFFSSSAHRAAICMRFGPKWGFAAQMLFDRALFVCGAVVVRRQCVMNAGGFDPELRLREDLDLFGRIIRKCGAYYDDHVSLHYRIGSPSLMHAPELTEADVRDLDYARRRSQAKFLSEYGAIEYYALKSFNKLVLRML